MRHSDWALPQFDHIQSLLDVLCFNDLHAGKLREAIKGVWGVVFFERNAPKDFLRENTMMQESPLMLASCYHKAP